MATSKYESIWQILSTNDFKKEIPEEYHCIICKNVTIEPFTALCECRFCSDCIKEYLKDGKKNCPGINNDCKEEYLEIDVNVLRDLRAIRSIRRISVKCPNETCEVRIDLENMSDHLRVCGMSKTKCPYENIGCQLRQISKDSVKIHYDDEWFTHSQLLVEAIDNLRNDVDQLRKVVISRDEEVNKLNEESVIKNMTIKEIKNDIDTLKLLIDKKDRGMEAMKEEFRKMIETQKKTMMEEFKIKDERRDREMEVMIETQKKTMMEDTNVKVNTMKQQINDQRKEIEELKVKNEIKDREMEVMIETQKKTMMEGFKNIKKDIVEMDLKEDIKDQKKRLNDSIVNQENIEREISSVIMKVRDLEINDEKEFYWRTNNFSQMKYDFQWRAVILFRYCYKIYLTLWRNGDYLGLYYRIIKGEFDNDLKWPMKHKINLSIINQDTMKVHKSEKYQYSKYSLNKSAFDKPVDKWNDYVGNLKFTTVKDIMESPGLLVNDSLLVFFNIDYN